MITPSRSPDECFRRFERHAQSLVGQTLSADHLPWFIYREVHCGTLQRRDQAGAAAIPVDTKYGRLFFFLWIQLRARRDPDGYRLEMEQYCYRLQETPRLTMQALIRWEFAPETAGQHPHHHLQLDSRMVSLADKTLDLDRLHTPTGHVCLEDVIWFVVQQLGARPACGADKVDALLAASLERLYEIV